MSACFFCFCLYLLINMMEKSDVYRLGSPDVKKQQLSMTCSIAVTVLCTLLYVRYRLEEENSRAWSEFFEIRIMQQMIFIFFKALLLKNFSIPNSSGSKRLFGGRLCDYLTLYPTLQYPHLTPDTLRLHSSSQTSF